MVYSDTPAYLPSCIAGEALVVDGVPDKLIIWPHDARRVMHYALIIWEFHDASEHWCDLEAHGEAHRTNTLALLCIIAGTCVVVYQHPR